MRTQMMNDRPKGIRQRVGDFFYREEVPYGMALVRILVPIGVMVALVFRWSVAREIYSSDGAVAPLWLMYGYETMLPIPNGAVAVGGFTLLLFFLVTSSIGWCTRLSLIAATVLYTWFNLLDTISTMTKYSVVATHALLLLSFSNCGAVWSVDAWLDRRRRRAAWPGETPARLRAPIWPRRLLQFMIGLCYFGAAITKLHTSTFFDGTQLIFWFLSQINLDNPAGQWLSMYPSVLVAFCYVTVVWEILFVFLAWKGFWRAAMLVIGATFHIGTFFTLGLEVFPMVCISIYCSFLEEQDFRALGRKFRGVRRRLAALAPVATVRALSDAAARRLADLPRYASPAALGTAAVAVAGTGLAIEHWMDPYGLRRPEGRHTLEVLDPAVVHEMFAPSRAIRHEDKVFSFDVGSTLVGGALLSRKAEFQHGDPLVAQVMLHPPHEDMVVECSLHDADDHAIDRQPRAIPREMMRMNYFFELPPSLPPGDYSVVITTSGTEVGRRSITIAPGDVPQHAALSGAAISAN